MDLNTLLTTTPAAWRKTSEALTLAANGKLSIRTKAAGGEWVDLLDAQVPNKKVWSVQITVQADETDPPA